MPKLAGELSEETPAAAAMRFGSTVARDRAAVARDRAGVARDRAAVDREFAARDRELSTAEIERAFIDQSSGAYGRQLGEVILNHEIARTQGARGTLVLGVIKIDESEDLHSGRRLTLDRIDTFSSPCRQGSGHLTRSLAGASRSSSVSFLMSPKWMPGSGSSRRAPISPSSTRVY